MRLVWNFLNQFYTDLRPNDPNYIHKLYTPKAVKEYQSNTPCYNVLIVDKYNSKYREKNTFIAVVYLQDLEYYNLDLGAKKCGSKLDCILDQRHQDKRRLSEAMLQFDRFKDRFKSDLTESIAPLTLNVETINNLETFLKRQEMIVNAINKK